MWVICFFASACLLLTGITLAAFSFSRKWRHIHPTLCLTVCTYLSAAVATPDFSIYPTMNINEIRHNIYMGRWLGRTWQNYGLSVIPTIGWALPDTYDMCFSAVESETPVIISTLGCTDYQEDFLRGFNEMKARINPPIILVFGNMIPGMTGTFLNFKYTESFAVKNKQLKIDGIPSIFTIKEAV